MDLYAQCLWHIFGQTLHHSYVPTSDRNVLTSDMGMTKTLRLGVVGEHPSNSSPGLCLDVSVCNVTT